MKESDMAEEKSFPTPVEFITTVPMYIDYKWEGDQVWKVLDLMFYKGPVDTYCIQCHAFATFQAVTPERPKELTDDIIKRLMIPTAVPDASLGEGPFQVQLICTRNKAHIQEYIFQLRRDPDKPLKPKQMKGHLQKIGQYPSVTDLMLPQLAKYRKILGESQYKELARAIGLASHDVGIGAFVYLRRTFEYLIETAHTDARQEADWDEAQYQRGRIDERIQILYKHLPQVMVEHRKIYSILSKGIHELSEEECLRHFDPIRAGIELILDDKLTEICRKSKIAQLKQFISNPGK